MNSSNVKGSRNNSKRSKIFDEISKIGKRLQELQISKKQYTEVTIRKSM